MPDLAAAVDALLRLDGVRDGVEGAREACTQLRWHPALRRRIPEAAAESRVRGARASAALDGAERRVEVVRDLMRGAQTWPDQPDPAEATLQAAVRAGAEGEHVLGLIKRAPLQALARLHVAAMADLVPADQLGRPRLPGEDCRELVEVGPAPDAAVASARLRQAMELVGLTGAPVVLIAALVHAEIAVARPFGRGNGIIARAMERAVLIAGGVDPTGVSVPEAGYVSQGGAAAYGGALAAYDRGDADGVRLWLTHAAGSVRAGAAEGTRIADAVLAGRTTG